MFAALTHMERCELTACASEGRASVMFQGIACPNLSDAVLQRLVAALRRTSGIQRDTTPSKKRKAYGSAVSCSDPEEQAPELGFDLEQITVLELDVDAQAMLRDKAAPAVPHLLLMSVGHWLDSVTLSGLACASLPATLSQCGSQAGFGGRFGSRCRAWSCRALAQPGLSTSN